MRNRMKRFLRDLWQDLQQNYRRRMLVIFCSALVFLVAAVTSYFLTDNLYDQQGAKRWSEEDDYAQLSCFYPVQETRDEYSFINMHYQLADELKKAAVSEEETEAKLFVDAYSVLGEVSMTTEHGSSTVNTYGVSDDFFLIHPVELLSGSYFDDEMIMGDGVILDELTAWELFGSYDVSGMPIEVNGVNSYVRGVVRQQKGHFYEAAGLYKSNCFMPFSTFENLARKTGGYSYEVIMPNRVSGFAKGIFETVVGVGEEEEKEVIENSSRFESDHMKEVIKSFGIRSMSQKGIIYPYWENVARAIEDICSILWLLKTIAAIVFIIFSIHVILKQWKKRKPEKGSLRKKLQQMRESLPNRDKTNVVKKKKKKSVHKKLRKKNGKNPELKKEAKILCESEKGGKYEKELD